MKLPENVLDEYGRFRGCDPEDSSAFPEHLQQLVHTVIRTVLINPNGRITLTVIFHCLLRLLCRKLSILHELFFQGRSHKTFQLPRIADPDPEMGKRVLHTFRDPLRRIHQGAVQIK